MMIPYLEALKKSNPGLVIGYRRDDNMKLLELYVFPGFMNRVLNYVRPAVSLDAAHLRSALTGTLYIASVSSGNNDAFPIGFMISGGCDDRENWRKKLTKLKEACPLIDEQGHGILTDADGVGRTMFLLVADRDKGLKPALRDVFLHNREMSCAKHIEANVSQKYGKRCGQFVVAMAKLFSTIYLSELLDNIRAMKEAAATYLEGITMSGILWQNTQWLNADSCLPRRYGIVTSNTIECVKNMLAEARNLDWSEALKQILDIMSSQICAWQPKYQQRKDWDVVPRVFQILTTDGM
jgi:hypothetical protein